MAGRHRPRVVRRAVPDHRPLAATPSVSTRRVDWLPIAPAAHYLSGGVVTDLHGATALPGLWAAGEVACTGVHGANRLASNSLLEGMVFGARLAEAILAGVDGPAPTGVLAGLDPRGRRFRVGRAESADRGHRRQLSGRRPRSTGRRASRRRGQGARPLQRAMTEGAGVVRTADSLAAAGEAVDRRPPVGSGPASTPPAASWPTWSPWPAPCSTAATRREETRGAHARRDHPEQSERWRRRIVHSVRAARRSTERHRPRRPAVVRRSQRTR